MKEINIFMRASEVNINEGICVAILEDENNNRDVLVKKIEERSLYRIIMLGLSEIINEIKTPSVLNIYLQSNIGFIYLFNDSEWCNRDIGNILLNSINSKKHISNFINWSELDKFSEIKLELVNKVRNLKRNKIYISADGGKCLFVSKPDNIEVDIFIRGKTDYCVKDRPGKFISIIRINEFEEELYGMDFDTTEYKMILLGLRESIKKLHKSSNINFYTHADIGLRGYLDGKSGPNLILANQVLELIKERNHGFIYNVSKYRQDDLKVRIKKYHLDI